MTDIVERLREQVTSDHVRGCMGRSYSCDCGYDLKTEGLLEMAADEIERLRAALELLLKKFGNCARLHGNGEEVIAEATKFARDALNDENKTENKADPKVSNHASPECQTCR